MARWLWVTLITILLVGGGGLAVSRSQAAGWPPAPAAGAGELLIQSLALEERLTVSYTQHVTTLYPRRSEQVVDRVWIQGPFFLRIERTSSGYDDGSVLVRNREGLFVQVPGVPHAYRGAPKQRVLGEPEPVLRRLFTGQRIRLAGVDEIMGRQAYVVERWVVPGMLVRYWIDVRTGLLLREERLAADGSPIYVMVRTGIDFSPHLQPGLFENPLPPGTPTLSDWGLWRQRAIVHRLLAEAPFRPLIPEPTGRAEPEELGPSSRQEPVFALEQAEILDAQGTPVVVLRIRYGGQVLSVYQTLDPRLASRLKNGQPVDVPDARAYVFRRGRIAVVLIGALSRNEAEWVLQRLREVP